MTIFAGLFCRHAGARVGDSTCDALRRSLSRDTRDAVSEFRDARVFLAKVDIGVYSEPAFLVRPGGSVSLLAGEPLLPTGDSHLARSRSADLALLHDSWDRSDWSPLAGARGVFCAVHYHPDASRLTLITDKQGYRTARAHQECGFAVDADVDLGEEHIGVYSEPAFLVRPGGSVSLLAGEPLLPTGDSHLARSRSADLALRLRARWE